MKYTVSRDETVRTVLVTLTGADPLLTGPHCHRAASFQPDLVRIQVRSTRTLVDVSGPIVLRSGKTSNSKRESRAWLWGSSLEGEPSEWLTHLVGSVLGVDTSPS